MYNGDSNPTLSNCTFSENLAHWEGGGMYNDVGSNSILTDCTFRHNSSGESGGGMYNRWSSPALTNCTFEGNSAGQSGGGISNRDSQPTLTNCTLTNNSASTGGGMYNYDNSNPILTNCIFWDGGNEISNDDNSTIMITYSNIQGSWPGVGNIDEDPLFAMPGHWSDINDPNIVVEPNDPNAVWVDGDYHLKSEYGRWDPNSESWVKNDVTSPCIDAGDPNSDFSDETWPYGERINMGAYGGTREASMSLETGGIILPHVAYIYHEEIESAKDYQALLTSYGCSTTLIPSHEVATTGFDAYDLIIAGTDTGYLTTWTNEQNVAAVENSGKPVVGLGNGGYWYFGQLGLSIGNPYGGYSRKNSIEVVDPNNSLYRTPYVIDIPDDRALQLYSETQHIGIYLWPTIPETVTVLGRQVDDVGYFPLIMEHRRYLLWGFTESPQKMTEVGKRLFINVVIWTANKAWESES
jgi:parallel beta-helix repeat protein